MEGEKQSFVWSSLDRDWPTLFLIKVLVIAYSCAGKYKQGWKSIFWIKRKTPNRDLFPSQIDFDECDENCEEIGRMPAVWLWSPQSEVNAALHKSSSNSFTHSQRNCVKISAIIVTQTMCWRRYFNQIFWFQLPHKRAFQKCQFACNGFWKNAPKERQENRSCPPKLNIA